MNADDMIMLGRAVQAAYGHIEITEDWYELWLMNFEMTDASDVAAAIDLWITTETYPPTIAGVREMMRQTAHGRRAIAPRGGTCDGSAWIANTERSSTPCPQCNPALFRVWSNPETLRQYREGVPLHALTEDVIDLNGTQQFVGSYPNTCRPWYGPDDEDQLLTPAEGRVVAAAAYAAECELDNREPSWTHFDKAIGGSS